MEDYKKYVVEQCDGCGEAVMQGKTFSTQGHTFHESCFKCEECGSKLKEDVPFYSQLRANVETKAANAVEDEEDNTEEEDDDAEAEDESGQQGDRPAKRRRNGKEEARDTEVSPSKRTRRDAAGASKKKAARRGAVQLLCRKCRFKSGAEGIGSLCAWCGEELEGDGVAALKKRWHEECFVCFDCEKPLMQSG